MYRKNLKLFYFYTASKKLIKIFEHITSIIMYRNFKTFLKTILFLSRYVDAMYRKNLKLKIKLNKFFTYDNNRHVSKT